MKRLVLCYPLKGLGTAEVGIALALVAVLMISFLVLGSHLNFAIDKTSSATEEPITLKIPQ